MKKMNTDKILDSKIIFDKIRITQTHTNGKLAKQKIAIFYKRKTLFDIESKPE